MGNFIKLTLIHGISGEETPVFINRNHLIGFFATGKGSTIMVVEEGETRMKVVEKPEEVIAALKA